jgi:hypothetical protein
MFAVVNHLNLKASVEDVRKAMERDGLKLLSDMPGFRGAYLVQNAETKATVILMWENGQAADNASKTFGPTWFNDNVFPHLASPQERTVGEIVIFAEKRP